MLSYPIVIASVMTAGVSMAKTVSNADPANEPRLGLDPTRQSLLLEVDFGTALFAHTLGASATVRDPSSGIGLKAQTRTIFGSSEYSTTTTYEAVMFDTQKPRSPFYLNLGVARARTQIYDDDNRAWWSLESRGYAGAVGMRWRGTHILVGVGILGGYWPAHKSEPETQSHAYSPDELRGTKKGVRDEYGGAGFVGTGSIGLVL